MTSVGPDIGRSSRRACNATVPRWACSCGAWRWRLGEMRCAVGRCMWGAAAVGERIDIVVTVMGDRLTWLMVDSF